MYRFEFDKRLGIFIPNLSKRWEQYDIDTQEKILLEWEANRGNIPKCIEQLEQQINHNQAILEKEVNFKRACDINTEISELASTIIDLWFWYRTHEVISGKDHH